MLKNYITIATRHLTRHKLFSVINILCLAIGITFSIIIGAYILNQESINTNLRHAQQQYFIKSKWKVKDLGLEITSISPLAKQLKKEYPNLVENYFRYNPVTNVVSAGENHFKEDIAICDTTLVSMYNFPLLYGNAQNAFPNNNSAVITETMAMKLFGTANAIGKTISMQTTVAGMPQDYIVSAVLKDIPFNSVTNLLNNSHYNVFVPIAGNHYFLAGGDYTDWTQALVLSYIELKPGVTAQMLDPVAGKMVKKYSADFVWKYLDEVLVPVKDYYVKDNNNAVQKMITALSLVAIFILLMAIINFVNITIGTSSYRLKEIGLRKVFGSARIQLIFQFITEAWLLTLTAAIISIVLYQALLPLFSNVLNTTLPSCWQFSIAQMIGLLLLVTCIGIVSGIYPAFILSSTAPVNAVKGKTGTLNNGIIVRKALLVLQFSLAITVFICTLNISRQVSYIFNKDPGYNSEQLLVITAFPKQWDSAGVAKMETIKKALLQLSSVKSAALSFDIPNAVPAGRIVLYPTKNANTASQISLAVSAADEDYAKTFGIKVMAGSFFSNNKDGIVLNETTVKMLGLTTQTAIGKQIQTPVTGAPVIISGVIKDFNFSSMQDAIGPIGFVHINSSNMFRYLSLKLNTASLPQTLKDIKAVWKSLSPNAPFDYTFMDEKFAALYKSELQLQKAADIATILNLIIVLMGIIGVVALTLVKRTKEIAVRKVLGADVITIILLFIKDYAWLILIANIIAWPLAYIATGKWLQSYAYRIEQSAMTYLLVGAFVFVAASALISLQCFKAAMMNPVNSLRSE